MCDLEINNNENLNIVSCTKEKKVVYVRRVGIK